MPESLLLREDRGSIVNLTLNRPERRNALSRALIDALGDAIDLIAAEPWIRAVILNGNGPAFCAGIDLKEIAAFWDGDEAEKAAVDDAHALAHMIQSLHRLPCLTIAVLHGDALGGGAGLAMACDFALMSTAARIGYPEVRRGLVAAIVLHDLVRLVGERRARQLLLAGELLTAPEALAWGLVNEVVAPEAGRLRALELARSLIECGPQAIATTKRLLDEATNRPTDLYGAAAVSASVWVSEEAAEGITAFMEKRPPAWTVEPSGSD